MFQLTLGGEHARLHFFYLNHFILFFRRRSGARITPSIRYLNKRTVQNLCEGRVGNYVIIMNIPTIKMDQALSNKKILIAEDEPATLNTLVDKFKQEGCIVVGAENGKMAFDLAIKEEPDILLLDILMPRMNGIEVLHKIRKESDWGRKVPIVILTNLSPNEELMSMIGENQPLLFLVKNDTELFRVVEKVRGCFENSKHNQS